MSDLDFSILNLDGAEDDYALKHLAGALIAYWNDLPDALRDSIYVHAIGGKSIGAPQTVQLKQQIDSLLRRNVDSFDA